VILDLLFREEAMVYVVASGKGGTGKTALSVGLSFAFAELSCRVLLIDGDTATRSLDTAMAVYEDAVFDFSDVAADRAIITDAVVHHGQYQNLSVLTAPIDQVDLEIDALRTVVEKAKEQRIADIIIIDAPAGFDAGFERCALAADKGIIAATADIISLRSADLAADKLISFGVRDIRLAVNRVNKKITGRSGMPNIDDAIDMSGLPLLGYIPDDREVITSLALGEPILKKKRSKAAAAYRDIAKRLASFDDLI